MPTRFFQSFPRIFPELCQRFRNAWPAGALAPPGTTPACLRRVLRWGVDKPENALEQAQHHVREGGTRITKQEGLIERLKRDGHENLLPAARALMEDAQGLSCEHLKTEEAKPPGALSDEA